VLVRADRTATLVGRHGTAVGLVSSFAVHATRHLLNPGDTLVFYTDGVTERRRGTEQFGQDRLTDTIAQFALEPPQRLIAALRSTVDAFSPEPHRDDIAIIAVHVVDH
jgi:serine phosphatase RsbU (regulator of sigma subunit)